MAKRGLGKGLSALIPELEEVTGAEVIDVDVKRIRPNPFQARQDFDEKKLEELAKSIREHGVVQPIIVRRVFGEAGFELVAGERRWRACEIAGLKTVPAVIKEFSEQEMLEIGLIENLQREDLNALEEAVAYQQLINQFNFTQEQVAERIGKSRPQIANTLRLLQLHPDAQLLVRNGELSFGQARALLGVEDQLKQLALAKMVVTKGLNVREVERLVAKEIRKTEEGSTARPVAQASEKDPMFGEAERVLREYFGCPVRIIPGRKKGKIEIQYYGARDLERILSMVASDGFFDDSGVEVEG